MAKKNTVALKKAVKNVLDHMPKEGLYALVQGAAVIGLHVRTEGSNIIPEAYFWSNLNKDAAIHTLETILMKLKEEVPANVEAAVE